MRSIIVAGNLGRRKAAFDGQRCQAVTSFLFIPFVTRPIAVSSSRMQLMTTRVATVVSDIARSGTSANTSTSRIMAAVAVMRGRKRCPVSVRKELTGEL